MWQKIIEKEVVKTIGQNWKMEREGKQVTKVTRSLTWIEFFFEKNLMNNNG
jgi:hypothetical protein